MENLESKSHPGENQPIAFSTPSLPGNVLRELIRQRVTREAAEFHTDRPEIYHGLVQTEESERTLNGYLGSSGVLMETGSRGLCIVHEPAGV